MLRPLASTSLGLAALAVSAGLLLAAVPADRPERETTALQVREAVFDCPYAGRLVIFEAGHVGFA